MNIRDRIPICKHSQRSGLSQQLCLFLDKLEKQLGYELTFSSGLRCAACNAAVGGVKNSAHLRGLAVDVIVDNSTERFHLVEIALHMGCKRIGIGRRFVHLDVDDSLPLNVLFLY